jgi:hypothetical protein
MTEKLKNLLSSSMPQFSKVNVRRIHAESFLQPFSRSAFQSFP